MFAAIKQRYIHFLTNHTYRQRFVFWMLLCLLCFPVPAYWIIRTQTFLISRADLQLQGNQQTYLWLEIFDAVLQDYIYVVADKAKAVDTSPRTISSLLKSLQSLNVNEEFAITELFKQSIVKSPSTKDIALVENLWDEIQQRKMANDFLPLNELYPKILDQILDKVHQLTFDYRLILRSRVWMYQLVKANFFSIPQDQLYVAQLASLALQTNAKGEIDPDLQKQISARLERFSEHSLQTRELLESAYTIMLEKKVIDDHTFIKARELVLETFRRNADFTQAIENALQNKGKSQVYVIKDLSFRSLANMKNSRQSVNRLLVNLTLYYKGNVEWQRLLIIFTLGFFLLGIIGVLMFALLSGYLILLKKYLEGIAKGNFQIPLYINPKEEMGQIALALRKMGRSIEEVIEKLRLLSQGVQQSVSKVSQTAKEQASSIAIQKKSLAYLQEPFAKMSTKAQELSGIMENFIRDYEQEQSGNTSNKRAGDIQERLKQLSESSTGITKVFSEAQTKLITTHNIVASMKKISENASTLSLNAALEVISLGENRQAFNDITSNIQRFATMTSLSTGKFQKVVAEMSHTLQGAQKTAGECVKEISVSSNRLLMVIHQLEVITLQDKEQAGYFQQVNEILKQQAGDSGKIMQLLNDFGSLVKKNEESVRTLYQTLSELEWHSKALQQILEGSFKREVSP